MSDFDALIGVLKLQAQACAAMGSPFSGDLLERAAAGISTEPGFASAFQPWAGKSAREIFADAAPLRWLGAMHDAALAAPGSPLALAYPSPDRPGDASAAWPHIAERMGVNLDVVVAFMRHEPQTNEVRRSAVLAPGFLSIAEATTLPLRSLELGASAGLNQLWDRRRYQFGRDLAWGPADAAVILDAEWRGGAPPLGAAVEVVGRGACDRAPLDLTDAAQRRRLRAYLWPDQFDRLARFDAAVAETIVGGVKVDRADAVAWTKANAAPRPGVATVVFHSVFVQYMPAESQAALIETLNRYGDQATTEGPLAWLRMEPSPDAPAIMELRLSLWPNGEDRLLAHAHPHGAWVEWRG